MDFHALLNRPLLLALCSTLLVTGCAKVKKVELTPAATVLTSVKGTAKLKATARDSDGQEVPNVALALRSSAPEIVSVDADGTVTALRTGEATITATSGGAISGTAKVSVSLPHALSLVPDTLAVDGIGKKARFSAVVLDDKGHEVPGATVEWENASPAVVSGEHGEYTSIAIGDAQVTAVANGIRASARILVRPTVQAVTVGGPTLKLTVGQTAALAPRATDRSGAPMAVALEYASSNPSVASVDLAGVVKGLSRGTAIVTVTAEARSAEVAVTVR